MYSNALLVKAAEMYYTRHSSQKEIAQHLGVSAATVSRILQEAVEQGVVRVRIVDTANRSLELAARLSERFGLERAEIIDSGHDRDAWKLKKLLGKAAKRLIPELCPPGGTVGIGSGGTIFEMIESLESGDGVQGMRVIPLMGGFATPHPERETNRLVSTMGSALNCTFSYLLAPAVVSSSAARDAFLAESQIARATALWDSADMAIFSIGPGLETSMYVFLSPEFLDIDEARALGAVGDILGRFIDGEGREIDFAFNRRLISIPFERLLRIPHRIGIGGGPSKYRSVRAALKAGIVTALVSDAATCEYILSEEPTLMEAKKE